MKKEIKTMTKKEHEFRIFINNKVKIEIEKTELEFGKVIRGLKEKGWIGRAIENWILIKVIERLLK